MENPYLPKDYVERLEALQKQLDETDNWPPQEQLPVVGDEEC